MQGISGRDNQMINLFKYVVFVLSSIIITSVIISPDEDEEIQMRITELRMSDGDPSVPKSITMYELLDTYSTFYDIPKYIAYNIAYKETRYKGPFHWSYTPEQTSFAGAVGPMQVMPATANYINGENVSREELKTNLSLNIETSMKLLRRLYDKYGSWKIVCGCYNTGRPIVNEYAIYCSSNKNYKNRWLSVD